jgi:SAM-dependent methyltransferase
VKPTALDYDQLATEYARHRKVHPGVLQALYRAVQQTAQDLPRALEIGCGTGNYILALTASTGCEGWGIDPSEGMLAKARARMAAHPQQTTRSVGAGRSPPQARSTAVQFRAGSAEELDFPDAFFDLVYSVDVVHHVPDVARYTREAYRALAPAGRFCTVTDSASIIRSREPLATYFPETVEADLARYPSIARLRALYEQAGFVEISERTVEFRYPLVDLQAYRDKAFSVLHLIPEEAFQRGIARMERELQDKHSRVPIHCVSRYTLLWGAR